MLKRRKIRTGNYCLVLWDEMAREYALGYDFLKKITYFSDGYFYKQEGYSPIKVENLRSKGMPVFDLTVGQEVPAESIEQTNVEASLGVVQLHGKLLR